jgi:AcrR family transcriptional regulator
VSTATRRYDNSTRQADAESRRTAIAAAAAKLFLENGYAETTIAQVAAAAGVSAQLVYAAFGGKAGLLSAALDQVAAGDDEPILMRDRPESLAIAQIMDPRERMRAAAVLAADVNARVGPLAKLLDRVAGSDPAVADVQAKLLAAQREDFRVIAERLTADRRPDLGIEQAAETARVLCGVQVWHGLVVEAGWSHDDYVDWLGDTLIRLFVMEEPRPARRRR